MRLPTIRDMQEWLCENELPRGTDSEFRRIAEIMMEAMIKKGSGEIPVNHLRECDFGIGLASIMYVLGVMMERRGK